MKLDNGFAINWNGQSRADIYAPPEFMGNTKGLCGTFDGDELNDLTTRENIVEFSVPAFVNSWKSDSTCSDLPDAEIPQPCDMYAHKRSSSEAACSVISDPAGPFSGMLPDCSAKLKCSICLLVK